MLLVIMFNLLQRCNNLRLGPPTYLARKRNTVPQRSHFHIKRGRNFPATTILCFLNSKRNCNIIRIMFTWSIAQGIKQRRLSWPEKRCGNELGNDGTACIDTQQIILDLFNRHVNKLWHPCYLTQWQSHNKYKTTNRGFQRNIFLELKRELRYVCFSLFYYQIQKLFTSESIIDSRQVKK